MKEWGRKRGGVEREGRDRQQSRSKNRQIRPIRQEVEGVDAEEEQKRGIMLSQTRVHGTHSVYFTKTHFLVSPLGKLDTS